MARSSSARPTGKPSPSTKPSRKEKRARPAWFGPWLRVAVIASVGVLVVAGLACAAYVSLSQAVITLTPKRQDVAVNFSLPVGRSTQEKDGLPTQLAGTLFDRHLEEKKTIEQLSEQEVDSQSGGTVRLINKRNGPMKLVKSTQLKPKGRDLIYRIQESVTIPTGGEISVRVLCDQTGTIGDIPASEFEIVKLFSSWKDQIYGVSDTPMSGGRVRAEILTQEQIDTLGTAFAEERKSASLEQIRTEHPDLTFPDNGVIAEIEGVDTSAKPGDRVDRLDLTARIHVVALAFPEHALLDAALQRLKREVPTGFVFLGIAPDSFHYSVDAYDLEHGTAQLTASLAGTAVSDIDATQFDRKQLAGRDALETANYFEQFPGVEAADVYFAPFWTTTIPVLASHTEIVVERPAPELPKPAEPIVAPEATPTPAGATTPAEGEAAPAASSETLPQTETAPQP